MRDISERGHETKTLHCLLAILAAETKLIRLRQSLDRKYDPDQPRAPAGQSDGGQWISYSRSMPGGRSVEENATSPDGTAIRSIYNHGNPLLDWNERHTVLGVDGSSTVFEIHGDVQTIRDGRSGDIIGRSVWTVDGPQQEAVVHTVFSRPIPPIGPGIVPTPESPFNNAIKLYEYLSSKDLAGKKVILGIRAREYKPNNQKNHNTPMVTWVGVRSIQDIKQACPRFPEVQERTDIAVATVKMLGTYSSPSDFGTKVHKYLENQIKRLRDPTFLSEVSLLKSAATATYGDPNSVRIDVYEEVKETTACVYDPKTGKSILTAARSLEIADHVAANLHHVEQILVIEIKPSQAINK